jgi:hypothetical protein
MQLLAVIEIKKQKVAVDIRYRIRAKTKADFYAETLRQTGVYAKFALILLLYSPVLIYQWIRHKLQPERYDTIASIDDRVESLYGFTESWYNQACIDTPVKLKMKYVDVNSLIRKSPEAKNRFLVNFSVVKIWALPENEALKDQLFTSQSYKCAEGVLLQAINPDNEQWKLIYYDLTTNSGKVLRQFDEYFRLDHIPKFKNGELGFEGDNDKQILEIRVMTTANTSQAGQHAASPQC